MSAGSVPLLALETLEERDPVGDASPPDRPSRTVVGAVLGAVVVVILLSVLSGRGSDDVDAQDPPEEATSTTVPPTPTSSRPSATAVPGASSFAGGQTLDPAFGFAVVLVSDRGAITVIDLGSGAERQVVDPVFDRGFEWSQWTGETFIAKAGDELRRLRMDGSNEWDVIDTGEFRDVYPNGMGRALYVWTESSGEGFGRVRGTGPAVLEVEYANSKGFFGPTLFGDDYAVSGGPDGVWLAPRSGSPQRLGYGTLLGAAGPRVVRKVCEPLDNCRIVVDDVVDGTQFTIASVASDAPITGAIPSPDGTAVAALFSEEARSPWILRILSVDGSPSAEVVLGPGWFESGSFRWSSDSDGLLWIDQFYGSYGGVRSMRWRNGTVSTEPAGLSLRMSPRGATDDPAANRALMAIAELPPGWTPTSAGP